MFIGFTPDSVAGVWVGNDDDKPMDRVTGGELAAKAWRGYMEQAHAFLPPREFEWLLPDQEPEMEDLADCLNKMGAKITRERDV